MKNLDISVVINGHAEGIIASPSLASLNLALTVCGQAGVNVEVISVLDRASELTVDVFNDWACFSDHKILRVDNGDLGLSRNCGVRAARGRWIAFLDADDLFSSNWLLSAINCAEQDARVIVWHPEVNVYFGRNPRLFLHEDMESISYTHAKLAVANCWTALCFTSRQLLVNVPYRESNLRRKIGYEDWAWNLETTSMGAIHKVVPETAHAIRVKATSLVQETTAAGCLTRPSGLYRNILLKRMSA